MGNKSLVIAVLGLVGFWIVSSCLFIVNEPERAVLLRFGKLHHANIDPGLHFKLPVGIDEVRKFDTRVLALDSTPREYLTVEQKPLVVDSYATWRIVDVAKFYTSTSGDESRAARLLSSRIDNGLRDQFGVRTMHEVISGQRDELMHEITEIIDQFTRSEFGIEVLDIRVKAIDLPTDVSTDVFRRMRTAREKIAQDHRSKGKELAEGIRADADRQQTIIEAQAYKESERIRGEGDEIAAKIYADAYSRNPEFYAFHRSLKAYEETFSSKADLMVIDPESEFFRYLKHRSLNQ
ncbi:membrane protease subunit HflC [Oleiphilus messinensis]|uniref:Protein HflC n=1 Tax=Oleiphilus messinensis TaxID=141451 RepID=A0A1Y0I6P7_9GAMM|nr:protease modulator HflC [Oleiphilus messinensis]ARU55910.1 membrane protease subunit HflC [Oleiphilus messinensis]